MNRLDGSHLADLAAEELMRTLALSTGEMVAGNQNAGA
jgi:hypothetical protein